MFSAKKTPDLSLTLPNPNPDPAPTRMKFVWKKSGFFFLLKKIVDHIKKRLLKKMVVHTDNIFSDFHMYVILDDNAVMR